MSRQMEVVKIAQSETARVSCAVQFLRSDISKSVAAMMKGDTGVWEECKSEMRINLETYIREADGIMYPKGEDDDVA